MSKRLSIDKLSPSAARLLLALLTVEADESYDEVVMRSGIDGLLTFIKARRQLVALGFIIQRDGKELTVVHEQEPERRAESFATMPRPGVVTRITDATEPRRMK